MLDIGMDAARDGLVGLAGASWMMSLPQRQAAYARPPAGHARPGLSADGGTGLVAVTFGNVAALAADRLVLPVCWEAVEPGDECTVRLDGSVTLAPGAGRRCSMLTLEGACQPPPGTLALDGCDQVRLELTDASRDLLASIALDMSRTAVPGPGHGHLGRARGGRRLRGRSPG